MVQGDEDESTEEEESGSARSSDAFNGLFSAMALGIYWLMTRLLLFLASLGEDSQFAGARQDEESSEEVTSGIGGEFEL